VVLRMLANVQQKTIEPIIGATVARNTLVYTDEYDIYARLEEWGYGHVRIPTMSAGHSEPKSATCSDPSRPAVPIDVGRGGGSPAGRW
jgi:hypothetical protein